MIVKVFSDCPGREEDFATCTRLHRFLVEHPLLVLELGFRPLLDVSQPYDFDVECTVPTARSDLHSGEHTSPF